MYGLSEPVTEEQPETVALVVREELGLETVLLRVTGRTSVEVESTQPAAKPPTGFRWVDAQLSPPADLRSQWHRPGWYRSVVEEVNVRLGELSLSPIEPPVQRRHTSLTGLLEIPLQESSLWLKAVPPIFGHEAGVIRWLGQHFSWHVPEVVADGRGWWLSRGFPGVAHEPPAEDYVQMLARMQIASIGHAEELQAIGCPVRSPAGLAAAMERLAARDDLLDAETRKALSASLGQLERCVSELNALDIPPTLIHGDAHQDNVLVTSRGWFLFDWTDSCISNPFIDLAVATRRLSSAQRVRRARAFALEWEAVLKASVVDRAVAAADLVGAAHEAASYQWFLTEIDVSAEDAAGRSRQRESLRRWTHQLIREVDGL
ncbi:aminoglycoside phosphotransferase family protein [Streptomyces sp900116325]|uniref:aminoglycoside phosphotransferase family protein n=1 Tax=Streptomyces sp. 900116325 TaxID=3154295 RepID=UPI003407192C